MKTKEQKRLEGKERNSYYQSLSTIQKKEHLDKKLGTNKGAEKQRAKLLAKFIEENEVE